LAQACHELREPLTAITGFSELLASRGPAPPDPEKQREYASIIHQSGQHLLSVVDALLDSIAGAGAPLAALERFAVAPLIELCCAMAKLKARRRGVELVCACTTDICEITSDRRLLTQIVLNLISNAIKFTPPGGRVTLSAAVHGDALTIAVSDTGSGILPHHLASIGRPFFRPGEPVPAEKGTGLGLSLVRTFAGLLGGAITVASEAGKGTCVRVSLPLDSGAAAAAGLPARIETASSLPAAAGQTCQTAGKVKKIA
jgi:cell cycle sensor histidine kinase DivJ